MWLIFLTFADNLTVKNNSAILGPSYGPDFLTGCVYGEYEDKFSDCIECPFGNYRK